MQKRAFTLTELLIALGIVGAIAAISIPSLMSTINNRVLASQLKNTVVGIQQVIDEQLTRNNTMSLSDTDFSSTNKLLSETNFSSGHPGGYSEYRHQPVKCFVAIFCELFWFDCNGRIYCSK